MSYSAFCSSHLGFKTEEEEWFTVAFFFSICHDTSPRLCMVRVLTRNYGAGYQAVALEMQEAARLGEMFLSLVTGSEVS